MKQFLCSLVAVGLLWAGAGITKGDYTFTTIAVPGATDTEADGINASGQIVGGYKMLPPMSMVSYWIRAATPRSTCPARTLPRPTGSTPRAKSWEFTSMLPQ